MFPHIQATPWTYQSQDQLRANTIWGKSAVYRAGGFAADLGPNQHNASRYAGHLEKSQKEEFKHLAVWYMKHFKKTPAKDSLTKETLDRSILLLI